MKRILYLLGAVTAYLALNGFECASSQMNSAEIAIRNKDYSKAQKALKEEVAVRPENARAWYLLGRTYFETDQYVEMKQAYDKALAAEPTSTSKIEQPEKVAMQFELFQAWATTHDAAQKAIRNSEGMLALKMVDTLEILSPKNPENLLLRGNANIVASNNSSDATKRTDYRSKANQAFADYVSLVEANVKKGTERGIALGMTQDEVMKAIGTPVSAPDPRNYQYFAVYEPDLLIYYSDDPTNPVVQGWTYMTPSPGALPPIRYWLSSTPFYNTALSYYEAKRYDDALQILDVSEKLDPKRDDIGNLIAQTYISAERTDEAKPILLKKIKDDPTNLRYRITYANLLHDLKDFEGATSTLKEALNLNVPKEGAEYEKVLYNLGAYYKNWGIDLEKKAETSPGSDVEEYNPKYRLALEYFDKLDNIRNDDYGLLSEMGNLYAVLEGPKSAGLSRVIDRMVALQSTYEKEAKYWSNLSLLYFFQEDEAKSTAANSRAKELQGQ